MAKTNSSNNINSSRSHLSTASSNSSVVVNDIRKCTISKDENGSFGLNIVGGIDQPHLPGYPYIFVTHVRRPDLLDVIRPGDRIIAINGILLDGKRHAEVIEVLREAKPGECTFTIVTNAERAIEKACKPEPPRTAKSASAEYVFGTPDLAEVLLVGIGVCALLVAVYAGYRLLKRSC